MKTEGSPGPVETSQFAAIAAAVVGWKPVYEAKTFWNGKPCNACRHFEMRMIKANESDSFGHVLPYCNHPHLPGEGGYQTQMTATCDLWNARQ